MSRRTTHRPSGRFDRFLWSFRKAIRAWSRRFGLVGFVLPVSFFVCSADIAYVLGQARVVDGIQLNQLASAMTVNRLPVALSDSGPSRVRAFEDLLVPMEEIPDVIRAILQAAEEERVTIEHAEYQITEDTAGGFLRWRMSFPVRAEAAALAHFMERTLRDHRAIILESVRLARQQPNASRVEARVQWVLLAHAAGGVSADGELRRLSAPKTTSR